MRRPAGVVVLVAGLALFTGCATTDGPAASSSSEVPPTVPVVAEPPVAAPPRTTVEPAPDCPDEGVRLTAGTGDAAMGLRVLTVYATNCGTRSVDLTGHPVVAVDGPHGPILATPGGEHIQDPGPRPLVLDPGHQACAVLSWRMKVEAGDVVTAETFSAAAGPGFEPEELVGLVDLGTTGVWFTTAWYQGQLPELTGVCGTVPDEPVPAGPGDVSH